jgi:hypothetical protein
MIIPSLAAGQVVEVVAMVIGNVAANAAEPIVVKREKSM